MVSLEEPLHEPPRDWIMPSRSDRVRGRLAVEHLEARNYPGGLLGFGTAALALVNSLVGVAARVATTAYQVGQLAWTGHTRLLFAKVEVSQPWALRSLGHQQPRKVLPPHHFRWVHVR